MDGSWSWDQGLIGHSHRANADSTIGRCSARVATVSLARCWCKRSSRARGRTAHRKLSVAVGKHVDPGAKVPVQSPTPPSASALLASQLLAWPVAGVGVPVVRKVVPLTVAPVLLHVGWRVDPEAKVPVQSPTPSQLLAGTMLVYAFPSFARTYRSRYSQRRMSAGTWFLTPKSPCDHQLHH